MLDGISQFGILMLLLLAGMETDLGLVRRVRKAAFSTSITGIALPFVAGFLMGFALPEQLVPDPAHRIVVCLFLGTALSISSVKIVATVVRDMGFMRRDVGQIILASAVVDDTLGWIIIAITLSLAEHGTLDWLAVARSFFGTLVFLAVSFTFGRQVVFRLIQWTNDFGRGDAPVIAMILVIMAAMALITSLIGVHTVLGAFVAGILLGESPILTRQIDEQLRGLTAALFMPVFFGLSGLSADFTALADGRLALLTVVLIAIASIGKASGAFLGSWFAGIKPAQSLALAAGMNARGSTEIIVASIGLSIGVISENLFTMIVAMAFVTTVAMPPMLRWALARLPIEEEEQKRLEREEVEARQLLASWERVLVVADDSPTGKLAAHLAGLLAGTRGMPVTVLRATDAPENDTGGEGKAEARPTTTTAAPPSPKPIEAHPEATETVKAAADAAPAGEGETAPAVDVIERAHDRPWEEAVAAEAEKGYDLLVVGISPTVAGDGGFEERVSRVALSFPGSLAIVAARDGLRRDPTRKNPKILVPVTGSEVSRRGAEIALALAKAAGTPLTAITVLPPDASRARQRYGDGRGRFRDAAETAKELRHIAKAMEQTVKVVQRTDISPEGAILREARRGAHDIIALGVSRRPGDRLSFGDLAGGLLESSERSLLFLSFQTVAPRPKRTEGGGAS
jgi:Kef-type K+ transport system membrane component KefB/nucleotide-binding universal stress UspA family protein